MKPTIIAGHPAHRERRETLDASCLATGATCTDIDQGETPIRCECGRLRQANRRCGATRSLVVRPLGR